MRHVKYLVGACLIRMPASLKIIEHYLVLVTLANGSRRWFYVIEKTRTGPRCREITHAEKSWIVEHRVPYKDLLPVLMRLRVALSWTGYNGLLDNCEQFGRFIIEGKHYSSQVRRATVGVACLATLAFLEPSQD